MEDRLSQIQSHSYDEYYIYFHNEFDGPYSYLLYKVTAGLNTLITLKWLCIQLGIDFIEYSSLTFAVSSYVATVHVRYMLPCMLGYRDSIQNS